MSSQVFPTRDAGDISNAFDSLGENPLRGTWPKELLEPGIREYREAFLKLYRIIAWNIFVQVRLPDGRRFAGHEIAERIDFERPRTSRVEDIVIAPRQGCSTGGRAPAAISSCPTAAGMIGEDGCCGVCEASKPLADVATDRREGQCRRHSAAVSG